MVNSYRSIKKLCKSPTDRRIQDARLPCSSSKVYTYLEKHGSVGRGEGTQGSRHVGEKRASLDSFFVKLNGVAIQRRL
jgi:hypothetical protein